MGSKVVRIDDSLYESIRKKAEAEGLEFTEASKLFVVDVFVDTTAKEKGGPKVAKDELGPVGTIYEVEQSPGFPKTLVEKRDLFGAGLKLRKLELERRKVALKEKELEAKTQSGKEAKKQYPAHPCNVEGCPITAHFATAAAYEAHMREYHPERFTKPRGHEAGRWWGR